MSELELNKISESLQKPNFTKKQDAINQRIGRLKEKCKQEKCKRVSAHYQIDLKVDKISGLVMALTFKQRNGKTLHIRQSTHPEEELSYIYSQLGISPAPGGRQRLSI